MDQKQIDILTQKIADKTISDEELKAYYDWLSSDDQQPLHISVAASKGELQERIFSNIAEKSSFTRVHSKKIRLWPRIVAAAAIAVVIFGGGLLYFGSKKPIAISSPIADIAPGKNGATLTLSNGRKIYISDENVGTLANESGVSISKTADGQIIYTIAENGDPSINAMNTLQTANGEQAQVRLPDGTIVYLNSASSLKYPSSFVKLAKRTVELSGEGFFEVSKDKLHPFIVRTAQQEVEVLGTQFNINSYAGEPAIKTTLLEGSVKITGANGLVKLLKPNQQAVNLAGNIQVSDVEAQFSVDWKEGFFMFNNENLESIMRRIARWYNVQIVYDDPALKSETFLGTISKYDNISKVIHSLQGMGVATFKLQGNVLTIGAKK